MGGAGLPGEDSSTSVFPSKNCCFKAVACQPVAFWVHEAKTRRLCQQVKLWKLYAQISHGTLGSTVSCGGCPKSGWLWKLRWTGQSSQRSNAAWATPVLTRLSSLLTGWTPRFRLSWRRPKPSPPESAFVREWGRGNLSPPHFIS